MCTASGIPGYRAEFYINKAPQESMTKHHQPTGDSIPSTQRRRARIVRLLWRAEMFYAAGLLAFAVLGFFAYSYAHFGWDATVQQAVELSAARS